MNAPSQIQEPWRNLGALAALPRKSAPAFPDCTVAIGRPTTLQSADSPRAPTCGPTRGPTRHPLRFVLTLATIVAGSGAASAAGWYTAEQCPEWTAMVQQVERLPEADRERLVEHMPTNPGMQRVRVLVLAALNFLANSGTSEQAAQLCRDLQRAEST